MSASTLWNRVALEPVPGFYRVKVGTTAPWCAAAIFYEIPVEPISDRAEIEHRKRLHNIAHFIDAPDISPTCPPVATIRRDFTYNPGDNRAPVLEDGGDDWHALDRGMRLTAHRDGFTVHPSVVWEARDLEHLDKAEHDYILDLLRYRRKHAPHEPHDPMKAVDLAKLPAVTP